MSVRVRPSALLASAELCSGSTGDFEFVSTNKLVSNFLKSRRSGLSPLTIQYYRKYLTRSEAIIGIQVSNQYISRFIESLACTTGGKHAYFRAIRAFYNWLYSHKSGYNLNPQDNPILLVDSPKVGKRILPSLTHEQVSTLIQNCSNLRDKCIISLLADSGIRLGELASVKPGNIDWGTYTVVIIGKGNKQRKAPFTDKTASLLKHYLNSNGHHNGNLWGINQNGLQKMIRTLSLHTGIKCNAHSFRRGFACHLHRKGLSTLDIMHLGGWADLSMVLRYTRSITFDDCLKHYREIEKH